MAYHHAMEKRESKKAETSPMPAIRCDHLFVYGTLMTAAATAGLGMSERAQLHAASCSLGPATLQGTLYNLGSYPAFVEGGADHGCVHGEVLEIYASASVFSWLDAYEGIDPANPSASEYARLLRCARRANGELIEVWVYVYQHQLDHALIIADGRWKPI